jgi:exodeoxyribonuclease-3
MIHGQKSYNGVAIVSRLPFVANGDGSGKRGWCGKEDCRHIWARFESGIELHNFYIPAGGDIPDPEANDKFAHKLQFLDEVTEWLGAQPDRRNTILVGDLNIAPLEHDVWSHKQLLDVVSHTPIEVEKLGRMQRAGGFVDAVRHFVPETEKLYSWWSYRAKDWDAADRGRRLDHVWVTPDLVAGLAQAEIHRPLRGWEKASDHVPVVVGLG